MSEDLRRLAGRGDNSLDRFLRERSHLQPSLAHRNQQTFQLLPRVSPTRKIITSGTESASYISNRPVVSVVEQKNVFWPSTAPPRQIITYGDASNETISSLPREQPSTLETFLTRVNPLAQIDEAPRRVLRPPTELQYYLARVNPSLRHEDTQRDEALQLYQASTRPHPLDKGDDSSKSPLSKVDPNRHGGEDMQELGNKGSVREKKYSPKKARDTIIQNTEPKLASSQGHTAASKLSGSEATLTKSTSINRRRKRHTFETVRKAFSFGTSRSGKGLLQGPLDPPLVCPLCSAADRAGVKHEPCDHRFAFNVDGKAYRFQDGSFKKGSSDENTAWIFGKVLDPRSKGIKRWNRVFVLSSAWSTAVDPLFLYLLGINKDLSCLFVEQDLAIAVTLLRTSFDFLKMVHMYLQLRLAYLSQESLTLGRGDLIWDARKVVYNYLHYKGGFLLDLYVVLPLPQMVLWILVPSMIPKGSQTPKIMTYLLITSVFQYIPKVFHTVSASRRMQLVTGFVFGTAWWGFVMNLTYYYIAAHVAGACWYLLAIQQVQQCMVDHCAQSPDDCYPLYLGCPRPVSRAQQPLSDLHRVNWGQSPVLSNNCLTRNATGDYDFGIYTLAVPLTEQHNIVNRILYPLFWGLMTLREAGSHKDLLRTGLSKYPYLPLFCTFGNALQPSSDNLEVGFSIVLVVCGLVLFMLLIGNIQVFLQSIILKKEEMQIRNRDMEWWMERRQLPPTIRQRVRGYERQRWAALRGIDESALVDDLPDGIRRDIKRHLCLDLVRNIPLFQQLDALVLDNVCERLQPQLFIKGEMVYKEGDPVSRMYFVSRGHFESSYSLSNNETSICVLGPGSFCGDELLSWALRRPHFEPFPPSTANLKSMDVTEVFSLEAYDLKYVTDHFRYKFESESLRQTVRFYSPSWRMWGAVTIQLAWRRHKMKWASRTRTSKDETVDQPPTTGTPRDSQNDDETKRMYAALIATHKPHEEGSRDTKNDDNVAARMARKSHKDGIDNNAAARIARDPKTPESEDTARIYTAMIASHKPHEDTSADAEEAKKNTAIRVDKIHRSSVNTTPSSTAILGTPKSREHQE